MTGFLDYEAACEAEAQTVYGMRFVELVPQSQTLVRLSVENILVAALGVEALYRRVKKFAPQMCGHRYDYVPVWSKDITGGAT